MISAAASHDRLVLLSGVGFGQVDAQRRPCGAAVEVLVPEVEEPRGVQEGVLLLAGLEAQDEPGLRVRGESEPLVLACGPFPIAAGQGVEFGGGVGGMSYLGLMSIMT